MRSSMRQMLAKKGAAKGPQRAEAAAAAPPAQDGCDLAAEDEDADPWPEMAIHFTPLGVEDARRRALELRRRGDFAGAHRLWAKAVFVARRSSPPVGSDTLAELMSEQAQALFDARNWASAERICGKALEHAPDADCAIQLLCCRARALAELGDAEGARESMAKAVAKDLDSMDGMDDIQEEARELEERLKELEAERKQATKQQQLRDAAPSAAPAPAQPARVPQNQPTSQPGDTTHDGSAAAYNQAFYNKMERDYTTMCSADGWEEIMRQQKDDEASARATAQAMAAEARQRFEEDIPANSDYHRVQVPAGGGRELRCDSSAGGGAPGSLHPEAEYYREKYRLKPTRPRRNLDELRRVEAETREAIEKEKAKFAAKSAASNGQASIRTKSDVVKIDRLSDSESEDEKKGKTGGDDEGDSDVDEDTEKLLKTFQEFERLGREKEERLAKWRHLYG